MKNCTKFNTTSLLLLLLLSFWSIVTQASNTLVGNIILAVGEVTATNPEGEERTLKRRSQVYSGDTLSTKSGARCQIRFTDKSLVALTESSLFKVDEYHFNQNSDEQEKAIYSLLKGGMRSISGAIGKTNREDYQLNTPVATIGIRGTAFDIGLLEVKGEQNLFGTVDSGVIVVKNSQGELEIQSGQNFQVQMSSMPRRILSLPKLFPSHDEGAGDPADSDEEAADNGDGDGDSNTDGLNEFSDSGTEGLTPEEPIVTGGAGAPIVPPTNPTTEPDIFTPGTLAPSGAAVGFALVGVGSGQDGIIDKNIIFYNKPADEIYIDTINGVGNVPVAGSFYDGDCNPCSFLAATGTLNTPYVGGDALGVNWGRWSGSYIVSENGVASATMGDFHYIYSDNVTPAAALQSLTGGYYRYSNGNGTLPTDENGATGSVTSIAVDIDFTNQNVTNVSMSVSTPSTGTITVNPSTTITIPLSDLTTSGITLDAANNFTVTSGYVGQINGTLIGPNAEGLMTTYGFREDTAGSTKAISGTALLLDTPM
jgi:hypothetical protein